MTTTSELRSQIESKGEEITRIAHRIEDRIEQYVDWKGAVNSRPLTSLAAAIGLGLVLSGATGPVLRFVGKQTAFVARGLFTATAIGYINSMANKANTASTPA